MSSDPFDVLGIDRATATDADVRRAYAERLKVTRPEDDRDAFMALRSAFENARREVRWRGEYAESGQDHSPPDAYGQSSAEAAAYAAEQAPEDVEERYLGDDDEDEDSEAEDPGFTPEETAAWLPVGRTLDRLTDVLTATGKPPAVRDVMTVVDHDDVSSISQFETMQGQVRQLLCTRTNYFMDGQDMRLPDWLSLEVLDALDAYYGWSRQHRTNNYVRGMNDWLARVRRAIERAAEPVKARNPAALEEVTSDLFGKKDPSQDRPRGGGAIWLWIGAGILVSQVVQFIGRVNQGG